jgi:hypothetical protein
VTRLPLLRGIGFECHSLPGLKVMLKSWTTNPRTGKRGNECSGPVGDCRTVPLLRAGPNARFA